MITSKKKISFPQISLPPFSSLFFINFFLKKRKSFFLRARYFCAKSFLMTVIKSNTFWKIWCTWEWWGKKVWWYLTEEDQNWIHLVHIYTQEWDRIPAIRRRWKIAETGIHIIHGRAVSNCPSLNIIPWINLNIRKILPKGGDISLD